MERKSLRTLILLLGLGNNASLIGFEPGLLVDLIVDSGGARPNLNGNRQLVLCLP